MMNKNPKELIRVLEILKSIGIHQNVVLIGSWVEIFYEEMIEGYEANIRTTDVDFLYLNVSNLQQRLIFLKL